MARSKKKTNKVLFYLAVIVSFTMIGSGMLLSYIATNQESMLFIFDTLVEKIKTKEDKSNYTGINQNISIKSNINL